jgi:hypothetical protein
MNLRFLARCAVRRARRCIKEFSARSRALLPSCPGGTTALAGAETSSVSAGCQVRTRRPWSDAIIWLPKDVCSPVGSPFWCASRMLAASIDIQCPETGDINALAASNLEARHKWRGGLSEGKQPSWRASGNQWAVCSRAGSIACIRRFRNRWDMPRKLCSDRDGL